MMNFVAICVVVSSLAAAGVWSPTPSPEKQNTNEEVIVKEGHRVVVVEFDQEGKSNTKVSISPPEDDQNHIPKHAYNVEPKKPSDALNSAKDKIKEMAHEAKDVVSETAHEVTDKKKEMAHKAKEAAKDAYGKAKENIKDARDMGDIAEKEVGNVRDSVVEKAKEGTEHVAKRLGQFLRYMGIPRTLNALMGVINLLGFSTAYGMCAWVTFISSYVLAGAMPRQQFGLVQSKIYPVYFRAMACCIGLALLGHMPLLLSSKAGMFQGFNLLASILMVLINSIYLEPLATKVMFERMKIEKEEGRGIGSQIGETRRVTEDQQTRTEPAAEGQAPAPQNPEQEEVRTKMVRLSERLKKLNTFSSVLNILTLMSLSWHLVYLSRSFHTTCY